MHSKCQLFGMAHGYQITSTQLAESRFLSAAMKLGNIGKITASVSLIPLHCIEATRFVYRILRAAEERDIAHFVQDIL